ncbi:MAG: HEAT repeat domain-containing protein [Planctomycetes bacterium]|nr:HEAT repeat domain-containing protein [Planctomycetota bacterium]
MPNTELPAPAPASDPIPAPDDPESRAGAAATAAAARRLSPRARFLLFLASVAAVGVPLITWYLTYFGRPLADDEIMRRLTEPDVKPRDIQHALNLLVDRVERRESAARQFHGPVAALASHREAEIRVEAALVMGGDSSSEPFHEALARLLADPEPRPRYQAALALSNFGDRKAAPVLRAMLWPCEVRAPRAGRLGPMLAGGEPVNVGAALCRILPTSTDDGGDGVDVRAPVKGTVQSVRRRQGEAVAEGDTLLSLAPPDDQVAQALLALRRVGGREELEEVERIASGSRGFPAWVAKEAAETKRLIAERLAAADGGSGE